MLRASLMLALAVALGGCWMVGRHDDGAGELWRAYRHVQESRP